MAPARSTRREAEQLWCQHTRRAEAPAGAPPVVARDEKTLRLRTLRLSREAEDAAKTKPDG